MGCVNNNPPKPIGQGNSVQTTYAKTSNRIVLEEFNEKEEAGR